jgi:hypothetical protein
MASEDPSTSRDRVSVSGGETEQGHKLDQLYSRIDLAGKKSILAENARPRS